MPNQEFKSLDHFESFISKTITPWSNEQRTLLAAAMAERWLPVYEVFSEENDWGKPAVFEDVVQTIWNCVLGHQKLTNDDLKLHTERMDKNTPHVDDFDCEQALAACSIISDALECCHRGNNTGWAARAMAYGVAGMAPVLYYDPEEVLPDVFQEPKVQNEIEKQFKLLEVVGSMAQIDQQQIEALRQELTSPDLMGPVAPRPKPEGGPSNQSIFERYRTVTETDIKRTRPWTDKYTVGYADNPLAFSTWGGRYVRRKYSIEKLSDVPAREALVAKNLAHDAAVQGDPAWEGTLRFSIKVSYAHQEAEFDVKSPQEPHRYGPSFRRLCIEGGTARAWEWTYHHPPSWKEEDQRKKNGLAYTAPELGELLTRQLSWHGTGDVEQPWATETDGQTWRVGVNDFPDDLMYTLIINNAVVGKFHDWPRNWDRS
jgi:uncharacterized protein YjaG (DUF416 family)